MTTQTHKWLPEQPTDEIIEAWFSNHEKGFEKAYKAMRQAAPEVEQEPVGYWNGKETVFFSHELAGYKLPSDCFIPLYTHPQPKQSEQSLDMVKRELLSDKELSELYLSLPLSTREDVCSYSFKKGFRQAEKADGIGVDE